MPLFILKRLGLILFLLEVYRILLLSVNYKSFPHFGLYEHLVGMWFDCITIALYFLPFVVLSLFPLPEKAHKIKMFTVNGIYYLTALLVFFFNAWDVGYFSYIFKRVSYDYFMYMLNNPETGSLADDFMLEFWWLISFFAVTFGLLMYVNWKSKKAEAVGFTVKNSLIFLVGIGLSVLIGRGGFQLKPVGVIEATNYCSLENAPAVLNSAFTMLKTYNNQGVEQKNYFPEKEALRYFNPVQVSQPQQLLKGKQNVVIVLFESFGSMYVGPGNPESFTPNLDSVLAHSMYFDKGIANGRISMDGVPAVSASIPTWMSESFILSSYSSNQFESLASILKPFGYSSAFYHGCNNGSMRFDAFTAAAGFDEYFGRNEYPNPAHYDGNWGIQDYYFMPWCVEKMATSKKPFFGMIFTLSSHHPFVVPKGFEDKVKKGPEKICATISYADLAFKAFWDKAKQQPWFDNTLFIFCADHVGSTSRADRNSLEWMYHIPIAFYHASEKLPKVQSGEAFQQIDIMPTVLDLINVKTKYHAFGTSYFAKKKQPKIIYNQENLVAFETGKEPLAWNESSNHKWTKEELKTIRQIKAIYQSYTTDLINNRLLPAK